MNDDVMMPSIQVSAHFLKTSKRSSSSLNDLLYERDRFRARHHNMNVADKEDSCEVCDGVGPKTTKLNLHRGEENDRLQSYCSIFATPVPSSPTRKAACGEADTRDELLSDGDLDDTRGKFAETLSDRLMHTCKNHKKRDWGIEGVEESKDKDINVTNENYKENFEQKEREKEHGIVEDTKSTMVSDDKESTIRNDKESSRNDKESTTRSDDTESTRTEEITKDDNHDISELENNLTNEEYSMDNHNHIDSHLFAHQAINQLDKIIGHKTTKQNINRNVNLEIGQQIKEMVDSKIHQESIPSKSFDRELNEKSIPSKSFDRESNEKSIPPKSFDRKSDEKSIPPTKHDKESEKSIEEINDRENESIKSNRERELPSLEPAFETKSTYEGESLAAASSIQSELSHKDELTISLSIASTSSSQTFHDALGDPAESTRSPLDPLSTFFRSLPCDGQIRRITETQLRGVFLWYFSRELPSTREMFPWLHGLSEENFTQRRFFLHHKGTAVLGDKPRGIRFLMAVDSAAINSECDMFKHLRNTVHVSEILQKIDVRKADVYATLDHIFSRIGETSTEMKDLLKIDCVETGLFPIFLNLDPKNGISLRNFHIQVCKLATCADFVVYPLREEDKDNVDRYARILWLAQRFEAAEQNTECDYNVFLLKEHTLHQRTVVKLDAKVVYAEHKRRESVKEEGSEEELKEDSIKKDDLQVDEEILNGKMISDNESHIDNVMPSRKLHTLSLLAHNDYQLREKIEAAKMSTASQICHQVWCGNAWDFQIMMAYLSERDSSFMGNAGNSYANSYCDTSNSTVSLGGGKAYELSDSELLMSLPRPKANWRLFVRCRNGGTFPSLATLADLLFKFSISSRQAGDEDESFYVLEFPPSGSIGIGDCHKENLVAIINMCKLMYLFSASSSNSAQGTLIFCSDGYTELSLLVLCFMMYASNISLQDAVLELHRKYGRPFYIFGTDVTILSKLEPMLRKFSPQSREIDWSQFENLTDSEINELLLGGSVNPSTCLGFIENDEWEADSDVLNDNWIGDVEGSLPSRIMPYLYLGSLKHANCTSLLRELGITHIISVGEQLDWLNGSNFKRFNIELRELIDGGNMELFHLRNTTVKKVLKVNNLQDDGIDELANALPKILSFIDEERDYSKILVHCRVGVSRSATVVIAEVMRRLKVSLPDAYLYVRVRRLNIIIQPNLRFMYELFKWEEQQKKRNNEVVLRDIDWFMMCREIMKLNIPYIRG